MAGVVQRGLQMAADDVGHFADQVSDIAVDLHLFGLYAEHLGRHPAPEIDRDVDVEKAGDLAGEVEAAHHAGDAGT